MTNDRSLLQGSRRRAKLSTTRPNALCPFSVALTAEGKCMTKASSAGNPRGKLFPHSCV